MAKRDYKWRTTVERDGWERLNAVTEAVEATYRLPSDDRTRYNLMLAGFKDTIIDAGALPAGSTTRERVAAMQAMHDSIMAGTWTMRDGRGTTGAKRLPDASIYAALVAVGMLTDNESSQTAWRNATPAKRLSYAARPKVAEWIAAHQPGAADAADALDNIIGDDDA